MSLPSSQNSPSPQYVVPKHKRSHCVQSGDVPVATPLVPSYAVPPVAAMFGISIDPAFLPAPGGAVYQQLPAVLVFHPTTSNGHTLHKCVSYGDLTPSEIDAVISPTSHTPSEVTPQLRPVHWATNIIEDDSAVSSSESGSETGSASVEGNPYVDDIAEEGSDESASGSEEEDKDGHDNPSASLPLPSPNIASTVRSSPCARTKTKRGLYMDTLCVFVILLTLCKHAVVLLTYFYACMTMSDLIHLLYVILVYFLTSFLIVIACQSRSTSCRPGRSRKEPFLLSSGASAGPGDGVHATSAAHTSAVSQPPSSTGMVQPTINLEDLDGPPVPSGKCSKVKKAKSSRNGEILAVRVDLAGGMPSDGTSCLPVKTLVMSTSVVHPNSAPASLAVQPGSSSTVSLLDSLNAFIGSTGRESSPEEDDDGVEQSPSVDVAAVTSSLVALLFLWSETSGGHSPSEPDDPSLRVMLPEIQEEQLRAFYLTLTYLSMFRAMVPLGQTVSNFDQPPYVTIEDVATLFTPHPLQSVVTWLYFVGHGCYCSLSTMPHPLFLFNGKKMLYNSSTCVAMIAGLVINCSIFKDGQQGGWSSATSTQGGRLLHSIRLLPFSQPWRRETTMIATVCNVPMSKSQSECMLSDGVEFTTRAFSSTPTNNRNKFPSPAVQKPSIPKSAPATSTCAKTSWPKSPAKPPTLASHAQSQYYHCLRFEDEVPIFDGRFSKGCHFLFHPEDFDNISTMPCVTHDLNWFALVAVGYTPGVWSPGSQPHVNLNIQFIVLLGQAPKPAALAKAGYAVE
ncbi:hypothetical protein EDD85DRAFT_961685 [Armillaria nabsnona]|nr:hypothetical protein EDD85DRAFT_961685 [Armillaria nabsnona]